MVYTEQALVQVARRENNNKRKYLVINRLQGKHIPVHPCEALSMFRALADTVKDIYRHERLLVIGFAETATAVGAAVACALGADYMQTTRELLPGVSYLYFSEEHSHATEQKLVKEDMDRAVGTVDRILFVEDEVTTGKTILNIIGILQKQYAKKINFSVASVLNGMDESAREAYNQSGIELFWLVKTDHTAYTKLAEAYQEDGRYIVCKDGRALLCKDSVLVGDNEGQAEKACMSGSECIWEDSILAGDNEGQAGKACVPGAECIWKDSVLAGRNEEQATKACGIRLERIRAQGRMDTRRLVDVTAYQQFCESVYQQLVSQGSLGGAQRILVLGTEEYMYPALYVAARLEAQGKEVWFHATTRSPIAVSAQKDYPLHTRYELYSFYDSARTTYIYDLQKYDTVVIMTDAGGDMDKGIRSLVCALAQCQNSHIILVCP